MMWEAYGGIPEDVKSRLGEINDKTILKKHIETGQESVNFCPVSMRASSAKQIRGCQGSVQLIILQSN